MVKRRKIFSEKIKSKKLDQYLKQDLLRIKEESQLIISLAFSYF